MHFLEWYKWNSIRIRTGLGRYYTDLTEDNFRNNFHCLEDSVPLFLNAANFSLWKLLFYNQTLIINAKISKITLNKIEVFCASFAFKKSVISYNIAYWYNG